MIEKAIKSFRSTKKNNHMTMECTWNIAKKRHICKVSDTLVKDDYKHKNIKWKHIKCHKVNANMKRAPCTVGADRMKTFCRGFKDLNDVQNKCFSSKINGLKSKKWTKKCKNVKKCMLDTETIFYGKNFFNHNLDVPILHFKERIKI